MHKIIICNVFDNYFIFFILALKESEKTDGLSIDDMIPSRIQLKISIWINLIWMREIIICDKFLISLILFYFSLEEK